MVYVYGVIAATHDRPPAVEGIEAAPVRLVRRGDLGALVSDLDTGSLSAPQAVRAHWRVLEEAARDATAIPTRFGMVLESDEAVAQRLLETNAAALHDLLQHLEGKVQLTVKGDYDEDRTLRELVKGDPAIAELRDRVRGISDEAGYFDRIRLGELVSQAFDRFRAGDTDAALARLEPLADAVRVQEVRRPAAAFDLAFLVARDGIDAFSAAVRALDRDVGDRIALSYVGPAPPYSFAEANLDEGSPAWA
jgi:gas vesicle protein GvpL/GvpF